MSRLVNLPDSAKLLSLTHGFEDDMHGFLTASATDKYTVVTAVDGTVTQQDAVGGRVIITNAVATIADNEDAYLVREAEGFLFAANKPLIFEAYEQFTQVDTNTTNIFAGLTDAAAANLLVNDGAGPKASGTTLGFFSKDGNANWHIHASLSTTQTSVELTAANSLDGAAHPSGGAAFQRLTIEYLPKNSTQADVVYYIDGVAVYKITDWVFTSATEVQAVVGVKGGTAAAASIVLDYWWCYQTR